VSACCLRVEEDIVFVCVICVQCVVCVLMLSRDRVVIAREISRFARFLGHKIKGYFSKWRPVPFRSTLYHHRPDNTSTPSFQDSRNDRSIVDLGRHRTSALASE